MLHLTPFLFLETFLVLAVDFLLFFVYVLPLFYVAYVFLLIVGLPGILLLIGGKGGVYLVFSHMLDPFIPTILYLYDFI